MEHVVNNETSRAIDRYLISDIGVDGVILMDTAARGVADAVLRSGRSGKIAVLIGGGNNGGDGLALMRILSLMGRKSIGILCCDPERLSGDAGKNYRIAVNMRLELTDDISAINDAAIVVDALFGTGLSRPIEGRARDAIFLANSCNAYKISIDIPSGINGDTGEIMGAAFMADETVTFQCVKRGLLLTPLREAVGKLTVCKIGYISSEEMLQFSDEMLIDESFVRMLLPDRKIVSNKGSYGRALIAAGSPGMCGAAVMAATAALRAGAGLVNAFVPESVAAAFLSRPEIMVNVDSDCRIDALISKARCIGIGCGSGNDAGLREKLIAVLKSGKPCVIDADALNIMDAELMGLLHENCVLTPHPGEMARLTGWDIEGIIGNPVDAARTFARCHHAILLLKSATTVIASPDGSVRYNVSGNPGLAKGGSGDVLTGIITALLAQGLSPFDAAGSGAFLLGTSADRAVELLKNRALIAGDVIDAIAKYANV